MTPRITASTPPTDWPLLLTLTETALILGRSKKAMQNRCTEGKCWPPPITSPEGCYQKPLRWRRETVSAYAGGEMPTRTRHFRTSVRNRRAA